MTYFLTIISIVSIIWLFESVMNLVNNDLAPTAFKMLGCIATIGILLYHAL